MTLQVDEGSRSETSYFTDGGYAVSSVEMSGELKVRLQLCDERGVPQLIEFLSGDLEYSDGVTRYIPYQVPQVEELRFTNTGMGGPLLTLPSGGTLEEGGLLRNEEHLQVINQGKLRVQYRARSFGLWFTLYDEEIDYAKDPQEDEIRGVNRVVAHPVEAERGGLVDVLSIEFKHTADDTPTEVEVAPGTLLTVVTVGAITASAKVEVPTLGFRQWLLASGLSVNRSRENGRLAVLYSLGLPPMTQSVPWQFSPGSRSASLVLPSTGTRLPVGVEMSRDLETWCLVDIPERGEWIEGGSVGEVEIPLPCDGPIFLRLRTGE
ncbi:MAG: hypothetical protein ACQKBU_11190 [Verrucomicrobiales bacterium]